MIKAILFDFDGLILDTETPMFTAWQEVYEEFACKLTLEEYSSCVGGSHVHFNPFDDLAAKSGKDLPAEVIRPRVSKISRQQIESQDALPGVRDLLKRAEKKGLQTALVSNSRRDWVEEHLGRLELLPHFEVIRTSEDGPMKPQPDLYLAALDALEIKPEEAIALEDSPPGILAARRAGIFVVGVPNKITRLLPLNEPDLELTSLAEMPLPELLEYVRRERVTL